MAKRRKAHKAMNKEVCEANSCRCYNVFAKLSSMAFILFLVLVWPTVGEALLSVHWGWYLGIFVVLGAAAMINKCWCWKK